MSFRDVNVKTVDDRSPILYPTRRIEIKTSKETIITPSRIASIYEYDRRPEIPTETKIENPISISVKKMSLSRVESFLKQNGSYKSLSTQIVNEFDRMKYSSLRVHIIQPTISKYKKTDPKTKKKIDVNPAVDYLADHANERSDFLKLVVKLQMDAGLDIISIPYLKLPFSEYKTLVKKGVEAIRNQNKEPLIVFDLDYKPHKGAFGEALDYFIKEAEVKLMAFPHKAFSSAAAAYTALSRQIYKDVAFLSFDVIRTYSPSNIISKMHTAPYIGTDMYAIRTPRYIPEPGEPAEERTNESIRFFNKDNLLIEPSSIRVKEPEKILEEMGESKDKDLLNILLNYNSVGTNQDKIAVIDALSKVHELKSSTKEFDTMQKRVKSNESTEYVKEKSNLQKTLTSLQKDKPK